MASLCSNKALLRKIGSRTIGFSHQHLTKEYFRELDGGHDFMEKMQKALTITEEIDKLSIKILKII